MSTAPLGAAVERHACLTQVIHRRQPTTAGMALILFRTHASHARGPFLPASPGISAGAAWASEVPVVVSVAARSTPTTGGGRRVRNDRCDPFASRRLVRALLLPQPPERAGSPWRVPRCEEAPLRPAPTPGGGTARRGHFPNRPRSLEMLPCAGSGVRSASSVRRGRGPKLAARGTSDMALWLGVRQRLSYSHRPGRSGNAPARTLTAGVLHVPGVYTSKTMSPGIAASQETTASA